MQPMAYIPAIDGLRAIAVLSVIAYHLAPSLLPGGFVGVDIFFVISGYVVSRSVAILPPMPIHHLLATFYARRIIRIVPALLACLLATTLLSVLFIPYAWLSGTTQKTGLAAFLGFSNLTLAATSDDYFSPRTDYNSFTHTWSLGVEEQFYLAFPWLFLAWLHARRHLTAIAFTALAGLSLLVASQHPSGAFYLLQTRFWELAAGFLAFLLSQRSPAPHPLRATLAATIGLLAIATALATTAPGATPYPGALLPVAGAFALLAALTLGPTPLTTALARPALVHLGRLSYALYLWHWPILVLFRWTVGLAGPATALPAIALTYAAAAFSNHAIEAPARRRLTRTSPTRYSPTRYSLARAAILAGGLAAIAAAWATAGGLWALRPLISLSVVNRHPADWYPDATIPLEAAGCALRHANRGFAGGVSESLTRTGCPDNGPHHLFVLGDSHVAAYENMLRRTALQTGTPTTIYSAGGCGVFFMATPLSPACARFIAAATAAITEQATPGDTLFLPALRLPRLIEQSEVFGQAAALASLNTDPAIRSRAEQQQAAAAFLREFAARGVRVIFEAPLPVFPAPPFRCADWFNRANPICAAGFTIDRAVIDALRAPILAAYASLAATEANLAIWDPLPLLCTATLCDAFRDGVPLFIDGDHLSGYANRLLAPDFQRFLAQLPPAALAR